MTAADQITAAQDALRAAASQGYSAFAAAQRELDQVLDANLPRRIVVVVGDTYRNRAALKAAGLRWDAMARGWVGTVRADYVAPAGCVETQYGAAVVASMDHADSMA